MYRHTFSNGHSSYPLGDPEAYHFSSHKYVNYESCMLQIITYLNRFQPRTQPALRRRRHMIVRLILTFLAFTSILLFLFPSLRSSLLPILSLGLYSATEEFQ